MLDRALRKIIEPSLDKVGLRLAKVGISANSITLFSLLIGIAAAISIAANWFILGLFLIVISRIGDGLDGAVARATSKTDFGGYLDITLDFLFYGTIVFGFIIANPSANAIIGAFLLVSFFFNGSSFLGFAILAEKHKMQTKKQGEKSLYFSDGLLEGSETIIFFLILCIWPNIFPPLAFTFAILAFITAIMRISHAKKIFKD